MFAPASVKAEIEAQQNQRIELPSSCWHVWNWFIALHNTRQQGFSSELAITYTEIKSYFDLMQIKPLDWEVQLIKKFDFAYLSAANNKNK